MDLLEHFVFYNLTPDALDLVRPVWADASDAEQLSARHQAKDILLHDWDWHTLDTLLIWLPLEETWRRHRSCHRILHARCTHRKVRRRESTYLLELLHSILLTRGVDRGNFSSLSCTSSGNHCLIIHSAIVVCCCIWFFLIHFEYFYVLTLLLIINYWVWFVFYKPIF